MYTFGSICSGIEAAQLAFKGLKLEQLWSSEIADFPSKVLEHHYPDIPNLGDMLLLPELINKGNVEAPDILCGGTPCQAFSLAGWKNGLKDERGQLTISFIDIANAIDSKRNKQGKPKSIVLWENVEGVLTDKTNAFGNFIAALAGYDKEIKVKKWPKAGYIGGNIRNVAWRVIDAKTYGLAQQRKRLYVIATGKEIDPKKILFEISEQQPPKTKGLKNIETYSLFPEMIECSDPKLYAQDEGVSIEVFRKYSDCLYAAYGTKWNGNAAAYNGSLYVSQNERLRRLSPIECERLMGMPDDYTNVYGATLTSRYQAIGNSWAVPVVKWIGEKIVSVLTEQDSSSINLDRIAPKTKSSNGIYLLGDTYQTLDNRYLNTTDSKSTPIFEHMINIITTKNIPPNIFISAKACAGILRRRQRRNLNMNERLKELMNSIASGLI